MAGIREIAKIAGVSQATVSRVLNRDENFSVSETTRNNILEIANELRYNPKKSVKSKSVDKLSIVIITTLSKDSEINEPYFISIRNGVEKEAAKWGVRIMNLIRFPQSNFDYELLSSYGGIVVIGSLTEEALNNIYQQNKNLIVVDEHRFLPNFDIIENDFQYQVHEELDVLSAKGHKQIAYIGGSATLVDENGKSTHILKDVRETAYEEWMGSKGYQKTIISSEWTTESGMYAAEKLLDQFPDVTAIVVASDPLAIGVYRGLQKAGKRIPDDIAIFSFDDVKTAEYLVPSLSTVKPGSEEMGRLAILLIRDRLFYNRKFPIRVTVPSVLNQRESI